MTHPAFTKALIHTCTVERNTPTTSATGEVTPSWATVATSVRCRYVQKSETLPAEGQSLQLARRDLLLLKSDADVQVGDRVSAIAYYLGGSSVVSGAFDVDALHKRHTTALHHLSADLERID